MLRRILLSVSLCAVVATPALAAPKKKKTETAALPKAAPAPAANEKAVSELMGPWKWGMTTDQVLAALGKQLAERVAPELAKVTDVYEQTRIRKEVKSDVEVVRKSYTKFEGQRSGWDVSIIEGEFLHKNGEAMMLYRENDPNTGREQQRFFFFHDGKLWKQFIAFNMDLYKGKTFDDFKDAMESRYGKGAPITRTDREGKTKTVAVAWKAGGTNLRAVDLLQFYANFCVVFSDASVDVKMDAERQARAPKVGAAPRAGVVGGASDDTVIDPNADVIDRITGTAPPVEPAKVEAAK